MRRLLPWVGLAVIYLCVRWDERHQRAKHRREWAAGLPRYYQLEWVDGPA